MLNDGEIRRMTLTQLGQTELTFGKHIGKKFDEVPLSYLAWCFEEGFVRGDLGLKLECYMKHPRTQQELDRDEKRAV